MLLYLQSNLHHLQEEKHTEIVNFPQVSPAGNNSSPLTFSGVYVSRPEVILVHTGRTTKANLHLFI